MRTPIVVLALAMAVGAAAVAQVCPGGPAPCPTVQPCPAPCPTVQPCPAPCPEPCPSAAPVCPPPCPPMGAGPMLTDMQLLQLPWACSLGLTQDQINTLHSQDWTNHDIFNAYAVAFKANVAVADVISAYNCIKDWNAVFAKYCVTQADMNQLMIAASTATDVDAFNRTFVSQYYGICEADLNTLRQKGFSWGDIMLMANASVRSSQPISVIADLRCQNMSWNDIATKFNLCLADLTRPVAMKASSARAICGSGPMVCPVAMYDLRGNVLLSFDMATNLYSRGYDWMDVAIAANVSKYSGIPLENPLERVRQGALWDNLLIRYGVAPCLAYNICDYPFPRTSVYSRAIQQARWNRIEQYQGPASSLTTGPCGVGVCGGSSPCPQAQQPCPAPCPPPCPPVSTPVCPATCPQ